MRSAWPVNPKSHSRHQSCFNRSRGLTQIAKVDSSGVPGGPGMNFYSGAPVSEYRFEPEDEVLPGVKWGRPEWILSPAYWAALANSDAEAGSLFRTPSSLPEEIAFCILGGYGVTAEINCAAFLRLKQDGIFERADPTSVEIEHLLSAPLNVNGAILRYRFPRQRAIRLSDALRTLRERPPPQTTSRELRSYLLSFSGIGPKTASWIVRNWLDADDVAIIDIHVHRAGLLMGLFSPSSVLPRDYFQMEARFLKFAEQISVRASFLDILIWTNMRKLGPTRAAKED